MTDALAKVIREQLQRLCQHGEMTLFPRDANRRGSVVEDDIAAAVAAHLLSEATIETMARAWCRHECSAHEDKVEGARCIPNCVGTWRELVEPARAAIRAALRRA